MKRLAGLSHNDQAHRQPERNETMKITDKQVEELGDLFYSISDKKGHHALTPELCDDLIGEVEKILSNSSGCSVEPMVISQKERTTLWYLYDKKRGHFVYHHLDEGWDDAGRPKCHTEGNRWAKEIAWKDKSEIAAFKVSYSEP